MATGLFGLFPGFGSASLPPAKPRAAPSLVLLTLDTTRADHVGPGAHGASLTPNLDALATRGTRYARALTASPLTLPAHCSLFTGLEPPSHGVRDNGVASLPSDLPTLSTVLANRGYATAAFVSSRVLDRRFGLDRGFGVYDDRMVAERLGEQGYPERDAKAVTTAALSWASRPPPGQPYFLWVHYYDPHAPYQAPGDRMDSPAARRYAGEVAYMDREVGRLLAGLPGASAGRLIAAVGDHGEMLGEHGERDHGLFLYRGSLEVPLVLAGPGVPAGRVVNQTVATRGLAATLLRLLGVARSPAVFGEGLPALDPDGPSAAGTGPVYSETLLPATAFGWSPLQSVSDQRWRFIAAPRPELYDFVADPAEARNLVSERPQEARRLQGVLEEIERSSPRRLAPAVALDPQHAESLRSLGYHAAVAAAPQVGGLDPKDGLALLAELDQAKDWLRAGRHREAEARLDDLVRRSPKSIPFLTRLAEAQAGSGRRDAALATLERAASLNSGLDFLHVHVAEAHLAQGRLPEARAGYERAVALNPRSARAWMGLAEIALRGGQPGEERRILRLGEAAGTESAALASRLAQVELAAGEWAAADDHARQATQRMPDLDVAWWIWGEVAERGGRPREALARFERAVALGLSDPQALLRLGRLLLGEGRVADARRHLERAAALGGQSPPAQEARRLLQSGQ